jgi:predicted DNA-binding transcriptional regulator YafY
MSKPTTRVLAVLELLQTHGRMSGAEIARRLEVNPRTVRNYIARLEEIGIPIATERGRDGGYMLVAGYKLPPMMFSDDEAVALSVGLVAARKLGLAEGAISVASAQAKIERVMPANLKRRLRAMNETITLDFRNPITPADNAALVTLTSAAQTRTRVRIRYHDLDRDVDPYGLVYRAGRWYVVAMDHARDALRTFRLDRIQSIVSSDTHFVRPPDFDVLAHLNESVATLPRTHAIEVVLHTDLPTARREIFVMMGVLSALDDSVRLRSQADDLTWFAHELARLPFAFTVRTPDALRDAVREVGRGLVEASSR